MFKTQFPYYYCVLVRKKSKNNLHYRLYQGATIKFYWRQQARLFFLVEAKTEEIAFLQVEIFEIAAELFLSTLIVCVTSPYLQFDDVLFTEIVDDYIHSVMVTCLFFDMVAANAVDDRTQVGEEHLASIVLNELVVTIHLVRLVHVIDETSKKTWNIKNSIVDELVLVGHALYEVCRVLVLRDKILVEPDFKHTTCNGKGTILLLDKVKHQSQIRSLVVVIERIAPRLEFRWKTECLTGIYRLLSR